MGLLDYSEKEYIWVIELNSSGFYKLWFNEIMTFNCAQFCFNNFSKYIVSVCLCVCCQTLAIQFSGGQWCLG